ncbi:MAG: DUF86 domain-containing protein [Planctomycetes bacterium]|nr:DUF86 domain-containing protein [Planctomycetota bacterium]
MPAAPVDVLRHILDEADYLSEQVGQRTKEEFLQDGSLKRAFVRSIEIIGEAAKNIPVDWRSLAGMRDRLIHHYFGVDYDIVWDVAANKIPEPRNEIAIILQRET